RGGGFCGPRAGALAEQQEFFVAFLLLADFWSGADFLNLRAASTRDVLVAWLDDDVALLAKRPEVGAYGGLQAFVIKLLGDFISDFVERLLAFVVLLVHLKNQVTLLGLLY